MVGFRIFQGTTDNPADKRVNEWIENHPNVDILHSQYQQTYYSTHSICIMYEEKTDEN